jgi:lysozyme family protein
MKRHFEACLVHVLQSEGGFVQHPLDPGGATNLGITWRTLAAWRGRPVSAADVRKLGRDEAAAIYRARYWDAVRGDELPAGIDLAVFDIAVNSGPARAVRLLQRALAVDEDAILGPRTLAAARVADPGRLIADLTLLRLGFLSRLATWRAFGRGWRARVLAVERRARQLAGLSPVLKEQPMNATKSILASRTLWSNVVGLAAIALSLAGFDTSALDAGAMSEAVLQIVAGGSILASSLFRLLATKRLVP